MKYAMSDIWKFLVSLLFFLLLSSKSFSNSPVYGKENFLNFVFEGLWDVTLVAFKIKFENTEDIYIASSDLGYLYNSINERNNIDSNEFVDMFLPIILHDEVYIVPEDLKDVFLNFHLVPYAYCLTCESGEECYELFSKEQLEEIILNSANLYFSSDALSCFVYKCIKENICVGMINENVFLREYPSVGLDKKSFNDHEKFEETDKNYKQLISFLLSSLHMNEGKVIAFKIQAYNSQDVYLYSGYVTDLYSYFLEIKGWSKEEFIGFFSNLLFEDNVYIVEEDMMESFFEHDLILFETCVNLYNYDTRLEYMILILSADVWINPIYKFSCFIYKALQRQVLPAFLNNKYFLLKHPILVK